jgi:cytoskeletal protein CcmA (bactofilin family)
LSCVPESSWLLYVDDELEPLERRSVEFHLVQCEACRSLVVGLREEADLLEGVLVGAPEVPAALSASRHQGFAMGLPAALVIVVAAGTVLSALLENALPSGFGWLNPLRLAGAYEMLFDVFFLARDQAPGLVTLAAGVAATASVAALAFFAVGLLARRVGGAAMIAVAGAALCVAGGPAEAFDIRHEERLVIEEGEVVRGTLVISADSVRIDGTLEGDLVVAAERLTIHGTVDGNVFAWARDVDVTGRVVGGLHAGGERVRIDGHVGGAVYTFGEVLELERGATVERDVGHGGREARLEGDVGRDVLFYGEELQLVGSVARDVTVLGAERVRLLATAEIGGDLTAVVGKDEDLEIADGARVAGIVEAKRGEHHLRDGLNRWVRPMFYVWLCVRIVAAFLLGVLVYAVFPGLFAGHLPDASSFGRSLLLGFAALVATPLALAVVALTLVGIPIAILGLFLYVLACYLGVVCAAALLGQSILGDPADPSVAAFARALALGLLIAGVAASLPWIGGAVRVVLLLVGLGLVVDRARALVYSPGTA